MRKRLFALSILSTCLLPAILFAASDSFETFINPDAVEVLTVRDDAAVTQLSVRTLDLTASQVFVDGEVFNRPAIGMEPTTSRPGWPELPMISRMVYVPFDAGVRLEIQHIESRIEGGYNPFILPVQDGSVSADLPGNPAVEFESFDGFWPPEPVVMGEPAIMRGYRMVQITIFPMQYNPATGQVRYNDQVDLELVYEGVGRNIVHDPDPRRYTSIFRTMLENLVVNPPPLRDHPHRGKRGSYLMIYPNVNGVEDAIEPLVEWRARQGWEVHTAEVGNNASTGTIKTIIQDAYDDWDNPPEMIALVGDAGGSVSLSAYDQTDFTYVQLDGNDMLPDAHIGRLSAESVNQLRTVVAKLVNYEADPYMGDTDWYLQGMVVAGFAASGISTIMNNKWLRRELFDRGYDNVHEWYYNAPFGGQSVPGFFQSEFQRGVSVSNYRGWINMEGTSVGAIMGFRAHRKYPTTIILTCGTGNYINTFGHSEAFFRSPGGSNGCVGFCTSGTHTKYNNAVSNGVWQGFLKYDHYHWGPAVNWGKIAIYRQYHGFDGAADNYIRWANLMGDPATHIFTGVPQIIEVEHDANLPLGGNHVTVTVTQEVDGEPVELADALVCLYKADDEYQATAFTDANGHVEFHFDPDMLSEGDLMVTVTKHNIKPYLGDIEIGEAEMFLGAGSWSVNDDDGGDGDETANPGETIDLTIDLTNFGAEVPEGAITVSAESINRWSEVVSDPVELEAAPEPGGSAEVTFTIEVDSAVPDYEPLVISVDATAGETTWHSVAAVEVEAPRLIITELDFEDGDLNRGEIKRLDIVVENVGRKQIGAFTATLRSSSGQVAVAEPFAEYEGIEPGDEGSVEGEQFLVRCHPFAIPGMNITLTMSIESEDGFRDTTTASFVLDEPGDGDPFGPDDYGYVCFDSEDEGWEMKPEYNWIEIDPDEDNNDYNGEDTGLRDTGNEQDRSTVVGIPFPFQYYGEEFDQLTICTNGWAAFGRWNELADFRNWRIASGGGPNAQMCVYWDNLRTGKILTHYIRDEGIFVVEWNDMRREYEAVGMTFQLLLYDPEVHQTFTGDGIIVYQYKDFNTGRTGPSWSNPYCTIGIGNLDDTDGLEYTYYDRYPDGATELEDGMAIKFTTATEYITGGIRGTVRDEATDEPIEGVWVRTTRGFADNTDENGDYEIVDVLIGTGYFITATAQGYNDSTDVGPEGMGYEVLEDSVLVIDFTMLHPQFNVNQPEFEFSMLPDSTTEAEFILTNDGNGTLWFTSRFAYVPDEGGQAGGASPVEERGAARSIRRDDQDEIWEPVLLWAAGDSVLDDRLNGVVFDGTYWIVSGTKDTRFESHFFYRFRSDGSFVDSLLQPVGGRTGIKDMEYYDGALYCVSSEQFVIKVNPETGEEIERYLTPRSLSNVTCVTIDPATGHFWASDRSNDIWELELVDGELVEVETFRPYDPRDGERIARYGLAWFRDDPDDYNLYMMTNIDINEDPELPDISIFKMDPTDGETQYLTSLPDLDPFDRGRSGISITPKWNNLVWVLATVLDNAEIGDRVVALELGPNSSWIDYSPRSDTLLAGESEPIEIIIETADLDTGIYRVIIEFTHNAGDGMTYIPVDLNVVHELPDVASGLGELPFVYELAQNWPNPFNPTTEIFYSLEKQGLTTLRIFDVRGREIATLIDEPLPAGRYHVSFNGGVLPAGMYFYQIKSGEFISVKKMVLIK